MHDICENKHGGNRESFAAWQTGSTALAHRGPTHRVPDRRTVYKLRITQDGFLERKNRDHKMSLNNGGIAHFFRRTQISNGAVSVWLP